MHASKSPKKSPSRRREGGEALVCVRFQAEIERCRIAKSFVPPVFTGHSHILPELSHVFSDASEFSPHALPRRKILEKNLARFTEGFRSDKP